MTITVTRLECISQAAATVSGRRPGMLPPMSHESPLRTQCTGKLPVTCGSARAFAIAGPGFSDVVRPPGGSDGQRTRTPAEISPSDSEPLDLTWARDPSGSRRIRPELPLPGKVSVSAAASSTRFAAANSVETFWPRWRRRRRRQPPRNSPLSGDARAQHDSKRKRFLK